MAIEWKTFSWEAVKGVALGISAVAAFFANQNAEQAKIGIEQAKIELDKSRTQLDKEKQQADLDMKAFEFVESVLKVDPGKATGEGLAAAAIVNALTVPPLRDGLQSALAAKGFNDPTLLRKIEDAQKFDSEQSTLNFSEPPRAQNQKQGSLSFDNILERISNNLIPPAQAKELDAYRVDIFYCEDTSRTITESRERQAKATLNLIRAQEPSAIPRVRLLPSLVQARPEYQVFTDEIRYNATENESGIAKKISEITKVTTLHNINYNSPGYISIFYCAK